MPRHPRTIWKPTSFDIGLVDTTAPVVAFFEAVRSVDADSSQGLQLKHVETTMSFGLVSTAQDNSARVGGQVGYFKWPKDAATPTLATIDLLNRTAIFSRKQFVVQGTQLSKVMIRAKTVRLKLGDALFMYTMKTAESSTDVVLHMQGQISHWETQA